MHFSAIEIFTVLTLFDPVQDPKMRPQKRSQMFHLGVELGHDLNYTETTICKLHIGEEINFQLRMGLAVCRQT